MAVKNDLIGPQPLKTDVEQYKKFIKKITPDYSIVLTRNYQLDKCVIGDLVVTNAHKLVCSVKTLEDLVREVKIKT